MLGGGAARGLAAELGLPPAKADARGHDQRQAGQAPEQQQWREQPVVGLDGPEPQLIQQQFDTLLSLKQVRSVCGQVIRGLVLPARSLTRLVRLRR